MVNKWYSHNKIQVLGLKSSLLSRQRVQLVECVVVVKQLGEHSVVPLESGYRELIK